MYMKIQGCNVPYFLDYTLGHLLILLTEVVDAALIQGQHLFELGWTFMNNNCIACA